MASSFLEMKAKEQAQKLEKKYGSSAYGGTTWLNEQITGKKKKKKKEEEEDIAPVKETTTKKTKDDRTWFQKSGLFDDGYQFGDVSKAIIAGSTDLYENVATGVIGLGEKFVDAATQLGAWSYGGLTPNEYGGYNYSAEQREKDRKEAAEFIAKDLYDERKIAKKLITEDVEKMHGIDVETASVFGDKTDSLAQSAGQLGVTAALSAAGLPFWVTTGITSFGGEVEQAYNEGATFNEATVSGLISAGAEILTEKIGGVSFGGKTLTDALTKRLTTGISSKVTKTLVKMGFDAAGEGFEEILSGVLGAVGQKITYQKDKELNELFSSEEAWESFIGGAVLGGGSNVTGIIKSSATGEDIVTGLSKNEQKVVDQLYNEEIAQREKNGEKLTLKAKEKIFDDIVEQMDKGYIDTSDIERVLGGEEYKTHTDTLAKEKSMQEEYDKLFNMKNGDKSDADIARQAELKKQLDDLKKNFNRTQMGENVFNMVKGDRLSESYAERSRRGQAFEADLSQYDSKYHATIQNAVNSGLLNNTRRSHELVDFIAKVSADKGVPFNFANNAKIKESGFALEGKTVNGYVTKDGVTINIDSPKYLNRTVGHEITHVMEGTELYDVMKQALFEHAKTKGEYDSRLAELTELYKDVEDADVEAELTADLVGDYIFTDDKFIRNLSVSNRNVFQKIWDEIKYLCKVATAGSKEARELERVKKAFEEAYREIGTSADGTKYSAMYKSRAKDIGEYYDFVQANKENSAERGKSYYSTELDDGSSIDILFDVLTHTGKRHNLSKEQLKAVLDGLGNGIVNATVGETQKSSFNGVPVKMVVETDTGETAGALVDFLQNGRTILRTAFFDSPERLNEWVKKDGFKALTSTLSGESSFLDSRLSMNNIRTESLKSQEASFVDDETAQNKQTVKQYSISDPDGRQLTKQMQLDIILESNPVNDDYHTWIRTVDDILTFEEALNSDDYADYKGEDFDESYPYSIAEEALKTGKIIVYSSHPIGQGVFVTPSRMEAQSYAGNGKVYSKEVNLTDVAWIDPTQGQYAKVDTFDSGVRNSLSREGEAPVRRRLSDIYGEDVKLRTAPDDVAPVADAENATTTPVPEMETTTEATSVAPVTVAENATVAEMETVAPDGYGARVEEIVEALSGLKRGQRKKFGGYSAGVYTRNGSDNITLSITMPDGTIVKDTIEGGKYWSNTQLAHEIASRIAESEGYAPVDESAPVEDIAPVAPVKEKAEAIRPKPQKEPRMARATPEEQARAQILTEEPEVPTQKGKNWQKLKREALDPGTVFETLALKKGNRELQARYSSIKRADKMAQRFMAKGNGSLDSIRKTVEQSGKTKQFSEYMYHMLNTDRMTLAERYDDVEDKPVFGYDVTAEMSKGIAAELEKANPEFKKWAQDVYSYMNTLREMMVENGVISAETAQLWQEQYPHYVPIRRAGKDGMAVNVPLDTGRTGINAPIKKATGGNSDILPMFDTMGQRTIQTFKAVAKNRFGVELMHTLGKPVETEAAGLDEIIDSMDTHEELIQKGEDGKSPTFTVFENGERVTFDITEEMYEAMQPAQGVSAFNSKALNKLNNIRRGLITEYNLMFTATNAIKDAQDVMINSQHPVKTYAAFPQAFKELLTGKGTYVTEYLDNGGEDLTYFDDQTKTFTGDKSTLRKVVGFPLDKISDLNNFIEKIPRLAEYIASRKDGRSIDVAMLDAARVTTDFSAGGHFVKMMNRNGFTFLNASVQGAVQQVRNIREAKYNGLKGWAQLAGKVVAAGLPAMLLNHLLWDDDEEYAELSDYVKQNYYIVGKFDDGKFVRIPKGRTMAVIQSAFQQMENLVTGNDEVDLAAFGQLVVNNLAPSNPLDNNLIAPIAQAIGNRTWYGEDLVPTRLQDLPSREQHDESTDSLSKWLGEKTGLSPYKINYVLDQYSGFVGDTLLPMLTPEAENGKDTFAGNMVAPWVDKFTTDSVFNNQNVSDFYDKKDELTITANGMNATDDDILASKYMNSINAELGKLYGAKRSIQNNLIPEGAEYDYLRKKYYPGMTMAEIAKAEKNGTLPEIEISDSEKYEIVRGIQSQIVELTKQSLDTYDDISYEEPHRGYDDDIAVIGGKYFTQNDDGEWSKMSDDAVLKYQITSTAGDSNYATDGVTSYYWYEPGEDSTAEAGWRKVTDEQLEKQREVTKALGISAKEYWSKKEEYDYAFKSPENYAVSKAVGGYEAYRTYSSEMYDIKADKDKNGKSISGSRKDKVVDYINGLDIDYYEKLILFKSEYTADDTYNYEIIEYLNGREDISYSDMVTILRKLGFTVDSRGNVTW